MYSTDEFYEGKRRDIINLETEASKSIDEQNFPPRLVKPVMSTRSRITPSSTIHDDHDYNEASCPSFDLHLYAHIDRSSLDRCVFTPVPHQTDVIDEQSQSISRKRKLQSTESGNDTRFGNDNGELAEIVYDMDKRLDELTRTCNGLRSSLHTLTKMVTQLVHNQRQITNIDDFDDTIPIGLPYERRSSNVTSKPTPMRKKRSRNNNNDSSSQRPTEFLCKLIRKVYSTDEIVAGIIADERLDHIKEAIVDRYFPDDPDRFEIFWAREAHQSILGQARAQRCRERKAGKYPSNNC